MRTNVIWRGDCLKVLSDGGDFPSESVDLVYMDPPFFTQRNYEVVWGDKAEVRSFEDRWAGGVENYISWLEPKIRALHRVLKPTGTIYVHCDWHANAHLRILLDKVFGEPHLRCELVWKRTTVHTAANGFGHIHDTILQYSKSDTFTWNPQYREYSVEYVAGFYKYKDEHFDKRGPYRHTDITGAGISAGESGSVWHGIDPKKIGNGRHWIRTPKALDELDAEGRIYWPSNTNSVPQVKKYLREMRGMPVGSVWDDIPSLGELSAGNERLGYPTQKPIALLERIINASSNAGDVVLDPFCGCGTAIAAAARLGRRWIGIDVSPKACGVMRQRMTSLEVPNVEILGAPSTMQEWHELQPFDFQRWVLRQLGGRMSERKTGDMGIDGWLPDGAPVQVKQQEHVGRNPVDNFETALRREKKSIGMIVAFSFGKGAIEEAARVRNLPNGNRLDITLRTVQEIMEES